MKVPFNQIGEQYLAEKKEVDAVIQEVLLSGQYIGGKAVTDFEEAFASFHGAGFAKGCANGTDALFLSLKALGIGRGDEVITTSFSWISTAMAISQTGATPIFVDIAPDRLQLDLQKAEKALTNKTKAILPVYLYGDFSKRAEFISFAKSHRIGLVEDAAQVHGLSLDMDQGLEDHLACFSFYPTKQLGALGDAGAVITNSARLAEKVGSLANLGRIDSSQEFTERGINSRLDPIQAAVLSYRLKRVKEQLVRRQEIAAIYDAALPAQVRGSYDIQSHTYHQYVIRSVNRVSLRDALAQAEIETATHYSFTLPCTQAYGSQLGFPEAENAAKEVISLPMDPLHTDDQIRYVCAVLNEMIN